jgi:hypothetical protein
MHITAGSEMKSAVSQDGLFGLSFHGRHAEV